MSSSASGRPRCWCLCVAASLRLAPGCPAPLMATTNTNNKTREVEDAPRGARGGREGRHCGGTARINCWRSRIARYRRLPPAAAPNVTAADVVSSGGRACSRATVMTPGPGSGSMVPAAPPSARSSCCSCVGDSGSSSCCCHVQVRWPLPSAACATATIRRDNHHAPPSASHRCAVRKQPCRGRDTRR